MVRARLVLICLLLLTASAAAEVIDIDNATLAKLLEQGVPIVDIRTAPEWRQTGIVKGSHMITFFDSSGRYDAEAFVRALNALVNPNDPVILICRTGSRTAPVATFLDQRANYQTVYNVRRGITHWMREGHSTVPPPQS